eukprot:jgi/Tetstr1/438769/TSEL_027278.t1
MKRHLKTSDGGEKHPQVWSSWEAGERAETSSEVKDFEMSDKGRVNQNDDTLDLPVAAEEHVEEGALPGAQQEYVNDDTRSRL